MPQPPSEPEQSHQSRERVIPIIHEVSKQPASQPHYSAKFEYNPQQQQQQQHHPDPERPVHYSSGPVPSAHVVKEQPSHRPTEGKPSEEAPRQLETDHQDHVEPKHEPPKPKSPLEIIEGILRDVRGLEGDVSSFNLPKSDRRYRYLEEMLTRNLLKLDSIDADGDEHIRQARKQAVHEIQGALDQLELKALACGQGGAHTTEEKDHVVSGNEQMSSCDNTMADQNTNSQSSDRAKSEEKMEVDSDSNQTAKADQVKEGNPSRVKEMVLGSEVQC
ncbi:BAG family molecular chaperone regulator [Solemya elarraichensis gill symbiont]|uniref:BAG domain-containing protein n=1 Tax=Solemya elarraichensis gill symbiont TaxID=1918949 RepID=A0A1T2KYZ3_9GAMM|nr:BAG family molecular chaperone regulator [Solemya elarraichensis gill symbiont]OOZ38077.1 hypothetical protein BOW52_09410 [Solemya elarraichensis gill symbiont]